MTAIKQLQDARVLVGRGWCQGAYARDTAGRVLDKRLPGAERATDAVCWCLSGALAEAGAFAFDRAYQTVRAFVQADCGVGCLITWNDKPGRSQEEVLTVLDMAIAAERSRNPSPATTETSAP